MEAQQGHRRTAMRGSRLALAALSGLLIGPTALAASNNIVDCGKIARDLQSLDVDDESLTLDSVEHMASNDVAGFDVPADAPVLESEAVAPVLLLTPRVATILREVFGPDILSSAAAGEPVSEPGGKAQAAPVPPVAKDTGSAPEPASIAPILPDESTTRYMPRFQRQMYRTDI